jgi:hypothetical protein
MVATNQYEVDGNAFFDRTLQVGGDVIETQSVTFENCLFIGNTVGPDGAGTFAGIMTVISASNEVTIKNSTFQSNSYGDPVNGVSRFTLCIVRVRLPMQISYAFLISS